MTVPPEGVTRFRSAGVGEQTRSTSLITALRRGNASISFGSGDACYTECSLNISYFSVLLGLMPRVYTFIIQLPIIFKCGQEIRRIPIRWDHWNFQANILLLSRRMPSALKENSNLQDHSKTWFSRFRMQGQSSLVAFRGSILRSRAEHQGFAYNLTS